MSGAGAARARWRARAGAAAVTAAGVLALHAAPAGAQAACAHVSRADFGDTTLEWTPPLDRDISIGARDEPLRDALDRLAAAAGVHLAYTAELLPLDRRVCAVFDAVPVGQALATLLAGVAVRPVAVARDQVVLAPAPVVDSRRSPLTVAPGRLDRVVVTGSATTPSWNELPYAHDVVRAGSLAGGGPTRMADVLDAGVPGLWLWEQSPSNLLANYGSLRGASSFGVSYPKVYIDGVEVANPLLLTTLDPQMVERVEVIRGPQGAALHGADALSGVVNVVTRYGRAPDGAPAAEFRTGAGVTASAWSPGGVLTQDHALALRGGSPTRSAALGIAWNSLGAWVDGGYHRSLSATTGARLVGARASVSGVARLYDARAGSTPNPLVAGVLASAAPSGQTRVRSLDRIWREPAAWAALPTHPATGTGGADTAHFVAADSAAASVVREYTLGLAATFQPSDRWSHSLVAGVDGYRLAGASPFDAPLPSPADSALRAARGSAARATLRLTSIARLGEPGRAATTLTLSAEQGVERVRHETIGRAAPPGGDSRADDLPAGERRGNTGLSAQGVTALGDAVFLSAGIRLEHLSDLPRSARFTALPMLGASVVRPLGAGTITLRVAWGRGIRDPRTAARGASWMGMREVAGSSSLGPEEQAGVEYGIDLTTPAGFSLHVTRFDQRASGLIQPVSLAVDAPFDDPVHPRWLGYELQNVGVIANRGWESQVGWNAGPLALSGTLSTVDSRVRHVAAGYTGDLRPGDRMLAVPGRTVSLTARWTASRWSTSWSLSRAADWVNYDRLALARAMASGTTPADHLPGAGLRAFWRDYAGVTRLRGALTHMLRSGLALEITGDNLLGRQLGEPDNVTILPGRAITAGLRTRF